MHKKTIQKILEDEETLDVMKTAEAILAKNERNSAHIPSRKNSLRAWAQIKKQRQEEESFKQKFAIAWNRTHNSKSSA